MLSPLLVRPTNGTHGFEIVAGARRYRAAQLAGLESVPVRIVELTDAQALETSIVENLQRRDVHPLDEASGFVSLLNLDYTPEQIAAKVGKSPAYIVARARLAELAPAVTEAFAKDEIGVGHAFASPAATRTSARGPCILLSGYVRQWRELETNPPAGAPSSVVDRAQHPS